MSVVSEHMGQGEAMPQQSIVKNAEANTEKSAQDQADIEAATMHSLPARKVVVPSESHKHLTEMNVRKLTRTQKSKLLDQVLKVRAPHPAAYSTLVCNAPAASTVRKSLNGTQGMAVSALTGAMLSCRAETLTQKHFLASSRHAWTGLAAPYAAQHVKTVHESPAGHNVSVTAALPRFCYWGLANLSHSE